MRLIDADALMADCQLAQKQADRHGREFANAFFSGGGDISTEWWCVEDMIENAPTIEPERKKGKWIPVTKIYKVTEGQFPQTHIEWVDATEPDEIDGVRCSECGTVYDFIEARNWCSECGARMER